MFERDTSGAPRTDELAPRTTAAAPGGPRRTDPAAPQGVPRSHALRFLIAYIQRRQEKPHDKANSS
jgi:hypothetical protein